MFQSTPLRANLKKVSINIPLALALGVLLTACGGGGSSTTTATSDNGNDNDGTTSTSTTGTTTTASGSTAPNIAAPDGARLLVSQCFQCHGMNGVSASGIESIAGDNAADLVSEMLEMKYSTKVDIMHNQAKGYSEDQIRAMATYIAALPKSGGAN